ncbi:MAG: SpoIIE family protein phosphatase, partial [Methylococcales bacterium]|nr:SpoIIE family protein phosphatase [Methylococcales bacterium]
LTALTDDESLAACVTAGGDDFLSKPFNRIILQAKIRAMLRLKHSYSVQLQQKKMLSNHAKQEEQEQLVAKKLFSNVVHTGSLESPNIKYIISPMSIFNGDMLLAAYSPSGSLFVMLGDFTGHGLKAAIGALPVSEIFYGMVAKGYSIGDIVFEINARLKKILPTGLFCAGSLVEFDPEYQSISIWSGGVPDTIVFHPEEGIRMKIEPKNVPLGILEPNTFNRSVQMYPLKEDDRIYLYSDGVIEAENAAGGMFGQSRLDQCFDKDSDPDFLFETVLGSLSDFVDGKSQTDDTTCIEILCNASHDQNETEEWKSKSRSKIPLGWDIALDLNADALKEVDPLPIITQTIMEIQGIIEHRERIYTVLAELFSNALDHGILGLDSKLKQSAEGFAQYYTQREENLNNLTDGFVKIHIRHDAVDNKGQLTIHIQDSGKGFEYQDQNTDMSHNTGHSGRGIPLIKTLCREFEYCGNGNEVTAIYEWEYKN